MNSAAWTRLVHWQAAAEELGFVYARSLGGLMLAGRGRIEQLSAQQLMLHAGASSIMVLLGGAQMEQGPQVFFSPDLHAAQQVDGVAVSLANHDWLFLTDKTLPQDAFQNLALHRNERLA